MKSNRTRIVVVLMVLLVVLPFLYERWQASRRIQYDIQGGLHLVLQPKPLTAAERTLEWGLVLLVCAFISIFVIGLARTLVKIIRQERPNSPD